MAEKSGSDIDGLPALMLVLVCVVNPVVPWTSKNLPGLLLLESERKLLLVCGIVLSCDRYGGVSPALLTVSKDEFLDSPLLPT